MQIRFPLHQRAGFSLRRKNTKKESQLQSVCLAFRLFASQLKSGRLGDSFAVFTASLILNIWSRKTHGQVNNPWRPFPAGLLLLINENKSLLFS